MKININNLAAWPGNPRRERNQEHIDAIAASMRAHGQITPIIVRKMGAKALGDADGEIYEVIAGVTRLMAAPIAGLGELDANVIECDDAIALDIATAENTQRRDMTPLEEADAFGRRAAGDPEKGIPALDVSTIAAMYGCTDIKVRQRLQLHALSNVAREALKAGEITLAYAQVLSSLPEDMQSIWVKKIIDSPHQFGDPAHLRRVIYTGDFLAKRAIFDLALYDGSYVQDLFADEDTRVFSDKAKAMALQLEAATAKAASLKKQWAFTEMMPGNRNDLALKFVPSFVGKMSAAERKSGGYGLIVLVHDDGTIEEVSPVRKVEDVKREKEELRAKEKEKRKEERAAGAGDGEVERGKTFMEMQAQLQGVTIAAAALDNPHIAKAILLLHIARKTPRVLDGSKAEALDLPFVAKALDTLNENTSDLLAELNDAEEQARRLAKLSPAALDGMLARAFASSIVRARVDDDTLSAVGSAFGLSVAEYCGAQDGVLNRLTRDELATEAAILEIEEPEKSKKGLVEQIKKSVGQAAWAPVGVDFERPARKKRAA